VGEVLMTDVERLESLASEADAALDMDEEAFRLFYQRTARPLWAYLSRVSRNRQAADDLLQESYYRLLKCGRTFDSDDHRRHYLFRIATNLVLDARRQAPSVGLHEASLEVDGSMRPGDAGDQAARRTDLAVALGRLKPRDRALVWLAYAQGASHAEIASITGLKSSSVKQLLFRARRRLAAFLRGAS
jgi:RNA polymerase sigma-70 factor, ECF subfamily